MTGTDDFEPTVRIDPQCNTCRYSEGHGFGSCAAFPEGIPADILMGRFDHHEPWPPSAQYPRGDRGIQYLRRANG
ncbi:MAG: hypothetical protein V2B18_20265 [Pseudomonadota bacterium]